MLIAGAVASASSTAGKSVESSARQDLSQIAAEARANVRPTHPEFPPGDVRRYGARGDGVADDSYAFQAAINVARLAGGKEIYSPEGAGGAVHIPAPDVFYLLTRPLDCTFEGAANQHGLALRADCGPSVDCPAIIARHTGHVFDLSGCDSAVFENLNIGTHASINPQTCFFLARNRTRGSAGYHRFRNVRVHGKFTAAILYNYGSESNVCSECVWYNESGAPGTKVAVFSSHNILGLKSSFIQIAGGPQSCIDHQIFGGNLVNTSGDAAADVIYLDAINSLKVFGPWMAAGYRSGGRALIYVDSANGASNFCELYGVQGEVGATQNFGIYLDGRRASTPRGWTIDGCFLPSARYAIAAETDCTLDSFHIRNLTEIVARGVSVAGAMQSSTVQAGAMPLALGVSRRNALIGDSSRWTIQKREHDSWMDCGSGNRTWAPKTADLTVHGKLSVSEASCVFHGPLVTASVTLAAESIQCATGTALGGLPAIAASKSAQVSVCDGESGAPIGAGMVSGTSIILPAIPARQSVVITATYFAA